MLRKLQDKKRGQRSETISTVCFSTGPLPRPGHSLPEFPDGHRHMDLNVIVYTGTSGLTVN